MKMFASLLVSFSLFFNLPYCSAKETENIRLGVWVTVFSTEGVLLSKENVDRMLDTSASCGIDDIYMQVYRADKAYYNSSITDASPYKNIASGAGCDTFSYLIKEAKKRDISVHAWINLLSIAQNEKANIVKTFGKSVL
ncbi:MAG: family 10 glycosylhydrolase, partial [Candidatus Omnitrophota bacterium]